MIYFDNACTAFPKAPGVSDAVKRFIDESCFNVNRGFYSGETEASETVLEARELIAELFSAHRAKNVVFTANVTQSINLALRGLLEPGDRVLTSSMEHNAVMRPLAAFEKAGVKIDYFKCNSDGEADLDNVETLLSTKPKVLVVNHASNVCGTIMPLTELGKLCKRYGVLLVVDAAQTAGIVDINMERDGIDALCFTGHKGLLATQGIGGCVFGDEAAKQIKPWIYGGTGSFSDSSEMPALLPDKFEAGTLNLPGIAALNASVKYLKKIGVANIFNAEKQLQDYFESGLKDIKAVRAVGAGSANRCAVTSLDFLTTDNAHAAYRLDSEHGIMTRSGLHCAPLAHKTLGTFPRGTVRISFGHTNTEAEINVLLNALRKF